MGTSTPTGVADVFCERCGGKLTATAKFCGQCGTAQSAAPARVSAPASQPVQAATVVPESAVPESAVTPYTICTIREVFEGPHDDDEGLLYPVPGVERDHILPERRDGSNVKRLSATAIELTPVSGGKSLLRVKEISAQVAITDARITIACSKFDKGGGWRAWGLGGLALSVPLNVASHALAARRRRGKMLVGQVRYPWVDGIYGQNRSGFSGAECLRIVVNTGGTSRTRLDLTLPKDVDATAVATELIRRTARFHLTHRTDFQEGERDRLLDLASVAPLVYDKASGKMAGHQFPTSWAPSPDSARMGLSA